MPLELRPRSTQTENALAVELLPEDSEHPKRIAWVFRQENATVAQTDERNFLGAAVLRLANNADILEGEYWNNRSWHRGLNTAGKITLHRL